MDGWQDSIKKAGTAQRGGRLQVCISHLQTSLQQAKSTKSPMRAAVSLANLAALLSIMGLRDEADHCFEELAKFPFSVGEPSALSHTILCNRAQHHHRYGLKAVARRDYLACLEDLYSPHRYQDSRLNATLSYALFQGELGKALQADSLLKRANQALPQQPLQQAHIRTWMTIVSAEVAFHSLRLSKAEFDLRQALAILENSGEEMEALHWGSGILLSMRAKDSLARVLLAQCYCQQNLERQQMLVKVQEAENLVLLALEETKRKLNHTSPLYLRCATTYVEILRWKKSEDAAQWKESILPWIEYLGRDSDRDELSGETCGLFQLESRLNREQPSYAGSAEVVAF